MYLLFVMNNLKTLKELKIEYPEIKDLNASTCQERYFKIHYPILHKYIIENTIQTAWSERLYMFYNDLTERPKCPVCGNSCKFFNIKTGYGLYCSRKCISKSDIIKHKKEENCIKKWGVKNPAQSDIVKNKIKTTNIEKYGVECVYQSDIVKNKIKTTNIEKYGVECVYQSDIVKNKIKTANIEKYGVEYSLQRPDVRDKIKQTCEEKYGVEYISQSEEFKNICKTNSIIKYGVDHPLKSDFIKYNIRQKHKEKYGVEYISQRPEVITKIVNSLRKNHMNRDENIIGFTKDSQNIIKCPHTDCDKCSEKYFIIPPGIYYDRKRIGAEICTRLLPIKSPSSTFELRLQKLLDTYNIDYITNVRNIISNELDIYIPSKNIAIEFNGVYWHSDKIKDKNYHINKYNECLKNNIQLISVWEDQYINKYNIIESLLLHKLGINKNRIFARKCSIIKVKPNVARNFYNKNHLQGMCGATVHYGLLYNNEIIAMMSFGKRAIADSSKWELIRFCNKINTCVVGGASKLFKHFIKEFNPNIIVSWSSNDISNGGMYKQLGFELINTSISYWYIKSYNRFHRSGFNKANLIKKGLSVKNDLRSEYQIMCDNNYLRIFDSGQSKWIWINR